MVFNIIRGSNYIKMNMQIIQIQQQKNVCSS